MVTQEVVVGSHGSFVKGRFDKKQRKGGERQTETVLRMSSGGPKGLILV